MLDVIIPVANLVPRSLHSRMETILYSLKNFYGRQSGLRFKIIIVEQSLDGKLYYLPNIPEKIKLDYHKPEIEIQKISIKYPVFNKSWCINVGFKYSKAPHVMIADPDIFCREDYFKDLLEWSKDYPWCFAWDALFYTEIEGKSLIIDGLDPKVVPHCGPKVGFSEGGLVLFRRETFKKMGMANEFIEELGGIDNEMMSRAREVFPEQHEYPMFVWHLWHEGSNKSSRPTRKTNVDICIKARSYPRKMINLLRRINEESCGSILEYPYVRNYDFTTEWGIKINKILLAESAKCAIL